MTLPGEHLASVVSPAPRSVWHQLIDSDPDAVVDQSPRWLDVHLTHRGQRDASRLYEFADGTRFVLPLVTRVDHRLAPRTGYASGWGMGGIVGPGLTPGRVSAIARDLASLPAVYTHIRPNPLQGDVWHRADVGPARRVERRAHVVDLRGGADQVLARFRTSGRRGIRKAERSGVRVGLHTGGDRLDEYYETLFLASVGRWAARQREPLALARLRARRRDPIAKLHAIAAAFGDDFRLYLAEVDGRLVAGNLVLWAPNAHATRGAMDDDVAPKVNASYALDWAAIQDACAAGHRWYQLGESGSNDSLAAYKERFGATAHAYAEYRFERVPLLAIDQRARSIVKRVIGFRD